MRYTCPVCGYSNLTKPPEDFYICPCCGTEFENDDFEVSHAELRDSWLSAGAPWFSQFTSPPSGWNIRKAYDQVFNAGLGYEITTQDMQSEITFIDLGNNQPLLETIPSAVNFQGRVNVLGQRMFDAMRQARLVHA